jgi:hypothetical protein
MAIWCLPEYPYPFFPSQDLRSLLVPNGNPRNWGQVALRQRVVTVLELMVNTSEFARRWIGDPTTPLDRLITEIRELKEGWGDAYVERIWNIKRKMVEEWRVPG